MTLPSIIRCGSTMDGRRCRYVRGHIGRHQHKDGPTTSSWGSDATKRQTYETTAPWITWTWLTTDRRTRITGRSKFRLTCCICGKHEVVTIRIPRVGPVPEPEGGVHRERHEAIQRHAHPGQRNPSDWALPLRNPAAWQGGLPLDVFVNIAETAVMEANERDDSGSSGDHP